MIIIEVSCGLSRQSIKASVPHRSFLRRGRERRKLMYEPVINRVEQPCRGADMLNMPSTKVLINSSAREGKGNPAACLISKKHFFFTSTHLSLFISRLIFCATTQGRKKKSRQLFVRPLLSIIAKIKINHCNDFSEDRAV